MPTKNQLWSRSEKRALQASTEKSFHHLLLDTLSFARKQGGQNRDEEFWAELRFRLKEKVDTMVDKVEQDLMSPSRKKEKAA